MTEYRRMNADDCPDVETLLRQCFSHPWNQRALEDMFCRDGYLSWVAEAEDKIIGYVGMRYVFEEADIINVAVLPGMRRQGIAGDLLRKLLADAGLLGVTSLFLEVRVSNLAAITLYEQAGFLPCGRRENYYTDPLEDALLMKYSFACGTKAVPE